MYLWIIGGGIGLDYTGGISTWTVWQATDGRGFKKREKGAVFYILLGKKVKILPTRHIRHPFFLFFFIQGVVFGLPFSLPAMKMID